MCPDKYKLLSNKSQPVIFQHIDHPQQVINNGERAWLLHLRMLLMINCKKAEIEKCLNTLLSDHRHSAVFGYLHMGCRGYPSFSQWQVKPGLQRFDPGS